MNTLHPFQFGDTVIWAYTEQQAQQLFNNIKNRIKE